MNHKTTTIKGGTLNESSHITGNQTKQSAAISQGGTDLFCHYAGFLLFMASIPLIDPTETDIGLFSSYEFLFSLNHLLSMAAFTILGSVMGARFIVEEYTGARAILLFSYPVSRRKIMGAKLCLVFFYSTAAMLLCGIATGFFFMLTECFFPICTDTMTGTMAAWIFFSLLFHSLLAGFLALLSSWIGFLKTSVLSPSYPELSSPVSCVRYCLLFTSFIRHFFW